MKRALKLSYYFFKWKGDKKMKKLVITMVAVTILAMTVDAANAATVGYIDVQKVFSSYDKTKNTEAKLKKMEKEIQDEIAKKQKLFEKEKNNNMSDGDLRKLAQKFDKEMEPKRTEFKEAQTKMMEEIQKDIIKAAEIVGKNMGFEVVLDKQSIVSGGTDLTDKVIEQLGKK